MKLKQLLFMLVAFLIYGCIEPYNFEAGEPDQIIIVDAELHDSFGVQQIKLSYQNQLESQQFKGVSNANVVVEDDAGTMTSFIETESGIYEAFFGAEKGRTYRLKIDFGEEGVITSEFQGVPPSIKTDSLSFVETKESFVNEDGKNRTLNVVKAYGQANISGNEEDLYLRFGNMETVFLFKERKNITFPPPKTCYVYNKDIVPEIGVFEIKANSEDVVIESLLFTKPIDWEFGTVFSIKADLISMNPSYYAYWKEIQEVYAQDGNINNPPPARIRTNLEVENMPPVVGYFALTSIDHSILYIRRSDLNTSILLTCGSEGGPFPWPYPDECNECLLIEGASTIRPDYW